jgi:hypothetical protein
MLRQGNLITYNCLTIFSDMHPRTSPTDSFIYLLSPLLSVSSSRIYLFARYLASGVSANACSSPPASGFVAQSSFRDILAHDPIRLAEMSSLIAPTSLYSLPSRSSLFHGSSPSTSGSAQLRSPLVLETLDARSAPSVRSI